MESIMKNIPCLIIALLTVANVSATEQVTKPTREQIIEFLEEEHRDRPLMEEEKGRWRGRERIDLVKRFGTNFTGLDLSGIDFKAFERSIFALGVDFSGCNMQGTIFPWESVLIGCNFTDTNLTDVNFLECELNYSNFSHAELSKTLFSYCNMQNVLFTDLDARTCDFRATDFSGAKQMNTDFSQANFLWGMNFSNANLTGAKLNHVDLSGIQFRGANLKDVQFRNSNLRLADFTSAHLEGTDFTGANLNAALFRWNGGIDEPQWRALTKQTARWKYDLNERFSDFLNINYYPFCLLTVLLVVIFSVMGLCQWNAELRTFVIGHALTRSFVTAFLANCFALFSTFCTLLMMFSGGHPVRQMSLGNMDAWSAWLHFFPIPLFGLLISIVVSFVLVLFMFSRLIWKRGDNRPWKLFLYLLLTLIHCLLAFNWLFMFMPDA
jgi:uncharacterized protein YjbI with pentapeptide repeats